MATGKEIQEAARKKDWQRLHEIAHEAGMAAGKSHTPTPMRVVERANPLDRNSPIVTDYGIETEGLCGFAWVVIRPATSSFARWLKQRGIGRTGYGGGTHIWVSEFGQSYERKEQYARAYAQVIKDAGLTAYWDSRLD